MNGPCASNIGGRPAHGLLVLGAALLAFPCGCASDPTQGYSFRPVHSESIRTVAVPIFENTSFSTGLESDLTEAIVKEIQQTTHWTISRASAADATLTGAVVSSEYRRLSGNVVTGLDQEMAVEVRVDFEFKDNRTGQVLVSRRGFQVTATFVASRTVGELPQVGRAGAVQAMARDIVAELRDSW